MIVGGEERYAFGITAKNLLTLGIEVKEHTASKGKFKPINGPKGCDIIIVMADVCDHRGINAARAVAKEAEIPVVVTHRKWATMKRDVGEVVQHVGIKAIQNAKKQRVINAKNAREEEQAELDAKGLAVANRAAVKANGDAQKSAIQQVTDATLLILEERPELVLQPDVLIERVTGLCGDEGKSVFDVKNLVRVEARKIQKAWFEDGAKCAPYGEPYERLKALHAIQHQWLNRWTQDAASKKGKVPTIVEIQKAAKAIFGRGIASRRLKTQNKELRKKMDAKMEDVWPKASKKLEEKSPTPPKRKKKPRRKQVVSKKVIQKTRQVLTAYFAAAKAVGVINYSDMDRETGNHIGRAAKWAHKLEEGTAEYLKDASLEAILRTTARWKKETRERQEETAPIAAPPKPLKPRARMVTEGATKPSSVSTDVKIAFVSGLTDKDVEMFKAAEQLRALGVPVPLQIEEYFGGTVPKEEPKVSVIPKTVEFDDVSPGVDVHIPVGTYAIRFYKPE